MLTLGLTQVWCVKTLMGSELSFENCFKFENGQEVGDRFGFSGMAMSSNGLRITAGATQADGVGAG